MMDSSAHEIRFKPCDDKSRRGVIVLLEVLIQRRRDSITLH